MSSFVFNNTIGNPYDFSWPIITKQQEELIIAGLFEQLLIFDKVTISTNRLNFALFFLINKLGINTVERLFECGYIQILLWTPFIVSSSGHQREDGSIDESVIYGKPPLSGGSITSNDLNPEDNMNKALSPFNLNRERRRIFSRIAQKYYIIPDGLKFARDSARIVIDSYEKNNLASLGLPYEKESTQLNLEERGTLLTLGHKVLETAILSEYGLKSFDSYEHYKICDENLKNIGKAYQLTENTSKILKLENLPDLKSLFIHEKLRFDDLFQLRHLSSAKYYRKWINEISESIDAQEISKEYINQIKGSSKFFNTSGGKLLRNLGIFGISTVLGSAILGPAAVTAGFALGLLDTFVLDGILKGKNPSMFISDIRSNLSDI